MTEAAAGHVQEVSTAGLSARDSFAFWRATAMRRMEPSLIEGRERQFRARVRRIAATSASLVDYRSDAVWMTRTARQVRADGGDEISLGLVVGASTGAEQNERELLLRRGELYVIDFGRPVRSMLADHHELAIMLPRGSVAAALGADPSTMGGVRLPDNGIGAVLKSHLAALAGEIDRLTQAERVVAIDAAAAMAVAAMQAALRRPLGEQRGGEGLHAAATAIIERRCSDSELTPERVARLVGCSRATLYRAFAAGGRGVARAIWSARLQRAGWLLPLPSSHNVPIAELAYRCGFVDPASFSRMFRRRYGMSPREARGSGIDLSAIARSEIDVG
jgi:AraC-like DNA-binding protein